jgi:hypothetical protein
MKKYKVIAGTCWSELTQSHLAHGAIVTTANFTDGEAQRKCNEGWLEEIVEQPTVIEEVSIIEESTEPMEDAPSPKPSKKSK